MSDCTGCRITQVLFILTELLWDHKFLSDVGKLRCRIAQVPLYYDHTGFQGQIQQNIVLHSTFNNKFIICISQNKFNLKIDGINMKRGIKIITM